MPHSKYIETELDETYACIDELTNAGREKGRCIVMAGDWNAVIGGRHNADDPDIIGTFGIGERNCRGVTLVHLATLQRLVIMNTRFQKRSETQWTHAGIENGINKRQIDFAGMDVSKRWWVTDVGTAEDLTLGADHRCVYIVLQGAPNPKETKE